MHTDSIAPKKNQTFVVGLTGGIGSGKTTIANLFAERSIDIVDADVVAREVVQPGSKALVEIAAHFGVEFILPNGQLDRTRLRAHIFSNDGHKQWLNALLHPLIRQNLLAQINATTSAYCLLVAPLLIENNLQQVVNTILVVDVSEQTQLARTLARDPSSADEIKRIMASQIPRAQRLSYANDIINNEANNLSAVDERVQRLHQGYLAAAALFMQNTR